MRMPIIILLITLTLPSTSNSFEGAMQRLQLQGRVLSLFSIGYMKSKDSNNINVFTKTNDSYKNGQKLIITDAEGNKLSSEKNFNLISKDESIYQSEVYNLALKDFKTQKVIIINVITN